MKQHDCRIMVSNRFVSVYEILFTQRLIPCGIICNSRFVARCKLPNNPPYQYDAYISFSPADAAWVEKHLLPRFDAAGVQVCGPRSMPLGRPIVANIETAVAQSRKIILLLTPNWIIESWRYYEARLARTSDPSAMSARTIPVLVQPCEVPGEIKALEIETADLTDPARRDGEFKRIIAAVLPDDIRPILAELQAILNPMSDRPGPVQNLRVMRLLQQVVEWTRQHTPLYDAVFRNVSVGNETPIQIGGSESELKQLLEELKSLYLDLQAKPQPSPLANRLHALLRQYSAIPDERTVRLAYMVVMADRQLYDEAKNLEEIIDDIDDLSVEDSLLLLKFTIVLRDHDSSTEVKKALTKWMREACTELSISTADFKKLKADLDASTAKKLDQAYLISIDPTKTQAHYGLRIWKWNEDHAYSCYQTESAYEGEVSDVRERFTELYDTLPIPPGAQIEFFLPNELLHEPVHAWYVNPPNEDPIYDSPPAQQLWENHIVIVRSQKRAFLTPKNNAQYDERVKDVQRRWYHKSCIISRQGEAPCPFHKHQICDHDECKTLGYMHTPENTSDYETLQYELSRSQNVGFAEASMPPEEYNPIKSVFPYVLNGGLPIGIWLDCESQRSTSMYSGVRLLAAEAQRLIAERNVDKLGRILLNWRQGGEIADACRRIVLFYDDPGRIPLPPQRENQQPETIG